MENMINIILADDHKIIRDGIKAFLREDQEINVVGEASNGNELLKTLSEVKPDVVLMDINMPEMDGFEATEQIRNSDSPNKKIPIFGLTADISANTNKKYFSLFNGFLLKPIEIDKIKSALSSVK